MGNPFYGVGFQRALRVNDLFETIAARYDCINDVQSAGLHRYWKRRLVQLARGQPGEFALDLCCGTGDVALRLADRGLRVMGLDFSPAMLAMARQRARRRPHLSVQFPLADALHIPAGDARFDLVTISFGLRNLADITAGLQEMWRVAKPGGRLLVLDFGWPASRWGRGLFVAYLKWIVPWFGRIFLHNADAYSYILESLQHYPPPQRLAEIMQDTGWRDVRIVRFWGGAMTIHRAEKPR